MSLWLEMKKESETSRNIRRPEGQYANFFRLGYNAFEFVFEFGRIYPETEKTQFETRIVTSPSFAKVLFETMRDSLDQYERSFGAIPGEEASSELFKLNVKKRSQ
jgi:hypothetical protein